MTDHHCIKHYQKAPQTLQEEETVLPEFPETTLDIEKYQSYLEGIDVSEEQAQEFLETLWNMMQTMVNMGLGLEGAQLYLDQCEQQAAQDFKQATQRKETAPAFNQSSTSFNKET